MTNSQILIDLYKRYTKRHIKKIFLSVFLAADFLSVSTFSVKDEHGGHSKDDGDVVSEDEWIGDIEEAEVKMPKEQSQGDEFEFAHEHALANCKFDE